MAITLITLTNNDHIVGDIIGDCDGFVKRDGAAIKVRNTFFMMQAPNTPGISLERYMFDKGDIIFMKSAISSIVSPIHPEILKNYLMKIKLYEEVIDDAVTDCLIHQNNDLSKMFNDKGDVILDDILSKVKGAIVKSKSVTDKPNHDTKSNVIDFINCKTIQ